MKLLFWKKDKESADQSRADKIKELREADYQDKASPKYRHTSAKQVILTPTHASESDAERMALHRRRYKVRSIKNWCEEKLTPVAWARVLVRTLPILRDYGYDFTEMQNPKASTRIHHDYYLVIRATLIEIYKQEYKAHETEVETEVA